MSSLQQPNFTLGRVERAAVLPRLRARRRRVARVAQLRVGGRDRGRVVVAQQPLAPGWGWGWGWGSGSGSFGLTLITVILTNHKLTLTLTLNQP